MVLIVCLYSGKCSKISSDGILIREGQDTKLIAVEWKLYVTITEPVSDPYILQDLEKVGQLITEYGMAPQQVYSWRSRIERLKQRLMIEVIQNKSKKRGIFNFGGRILKGLFGLSTEEDITEIHHILHRMNSKGQAIVTRVNSLTSILHANRVFLNQNREQLNKIAVMNSHIGKEITVIEKGFNMLRWILHVSRILGDLELKIEFYEHEHENYRTQKRALERGQLTEELLPVSILKQILRDARNEDRQVLGTEWYFMHSHVVPIWEGAQSIYHVNIPLVTAKSLKLYKIQSWIVPTSPRGGVYVDVAGDYIYDTIDGGLMRPQDCYGINPVVCPQRNFYHGKRIRCVEGLLTDRPEMAKYCKTQGVQSNLSSQFLWLTSCSASMSKSSMFISKKQHVHLKKSSMFISKKAACISKKQGVP